MSGDKYATASLVIPLGLSLSSICQKLKTRVSTGAATNVVSSLIEGFLKRFGNLEKNHTLKLVTFLDPRFKNMVFSTQDVAQNIKQTAISMVREKTAEAESAKTLQNEDFVPEF